MNNTNVRQLVFAVIISIIFISAAQNVSAQTASTKNKNPFPVKYTSAVDQKIILKTITLAPVYDNVNGIYAAPIQKLLIDLLQSDKVWGYSEFPNFSQKIFVENFDSKPNEVLEALQKTGSQAMLTALVTKGPRGLNARLKLFTQDQGIVLLEESFQDLNTFEISKLREEFVILYHKLKNKLPYRGFVLSRRGIEVTLNLGAQNGVTLGQELTLAQILKLNRHPKLKTLVGIEKEIIGRLKVTKVEPYLSFAQIIFEKETGVVDVGAKVLPTEYVSYPMPIINSEGDVIDDQKTIIKNRSQDLMNEPSTPEPESTGSTKESSPSAYKIGKVIAQAGISQFSESTSLQSGASVSASQSVAPTINLGAQIVVYPSFYVDFNMKQLFFNADHSLAGSTPSSLSYTFSRYTGAIGYTHLLEDTTWGPQVSAQVGLTSYKTQVSDTTPTAFTSTQTDGISLKVIGVMPLQPEYPVEIGANVEFLINPKFSESPVDSGPNSTSVSSYGIFATYAHAKNLKYRFDLSLENIDSTFNGAATRLDPSTTSNIKTISQVIGIEYLF